MTCAANGGCPKLTIFPAIERFTFHTLAGALATSTRNTPAGHRVAGQVLLDDQMRPAIRIRWVLSSSPSLPSCNRRHQVRNPPGV
jgi:hypothetical protein